eukprot:363779-Chlamydomonas_euryale.AAC.4
MRRPPAWCLRDRGAPQRCTCLRLRRRRMQQVHLVYIEQPPEAAEAAEPGTEVTRDAGSAPEPDPAAECGEAAWATPDLIRTRLLIRSLVLRLRRRWCRVTTARHSNLSA